MIKDKMSKKMARLYSEGLSHGQLAKFFGLDRSVVGVHLRGLGLFSRVNIDENRRDKAWAKISCAMHLADLHREHGTARDKAA